MLSGRTAVDTIWILRNTQPRGPRHRPRLWRSGQLLQCEVKLGLRRCIRAKCGIHSWFRRTCECLKWELCLVELSYFWKFESRVSVFAELTWECRFTVTVPGRDGCCRGQYRKQEFQLCTNMPDPHPPTVLNTHFCIYLQPVKIKQRLLHIHLWMLLKTRETIDESVFYCLPGDQNVISPVH